ncbi:ribonuclease I [Andreprevotia lacus DSM 23236]|uniref:Ribonuclease I n=1 Tax=Andreprevotia lacus DSM 23236 TaxID=1121001 RepID=A0A1W1X8I7_9NEIS|nr:ribonuclease I [Andreprevotia lacus]SMC20229.1 ribonuclease I [Andreprevotia lacus DSM 23236]
MKRIACLLLLVGATAAAAEAPLQPKALGDFRQYVLALSWQPAFCQQQLQKKDGPLPAECRKDPAYADARQYLTVHGLWPDLPASLAGKMQDADYYQKLARWYRFGCAAQPLAFAAVDAANKCPKKPLQFDGELAQALAVDMPGAMASCLADYEYQKHGVCFEFEPASYFRTMSNLLRQFRDSGWGKLIGSRYGMAVRKDDLLAAMGQSFGFQARNAVRLLCNGKPGEQVLAEVQIPILADRINTPLLADAFGSADPAPLPNECGAIFQLNSNDFPRSEGEAKPAPLREQ